jgi:Domain of unknown function (DUF4166)
VNAPSLYRRVLGESFALLPAALQRFHDQPSGGRGSGHFQIRRGAGRIRNCLVSLLGFPPAAEETLVTLQVFVEGQRERWHRSFAGPRMDTIQWERHGLLIEAAGPMRFGFRLSADATGMEFKLHRAWFFFVRLPLLLIPNVAASTRVGDNGAWHVAVRMTDPFGGLLIAYEGLLQVE